MLREKLEHTGRCPASFEEIIEADSTMSLGEAITVGPEDQWHMGIRECGEAELLTKPHLPWCGKQEIIGPHHLLDVLGTVIDDNGQIVGENPVISHQNQVIDDCFDGAADRVDKPHDRPVGPKPQGRPPTSIQ